MRITICSGGTGSIALTEGLKKLAPHAHITTILNAYDDGKSTGEVRKVMNVLGPSDIRKRHIQLYKLTHEIHDKRIIEFYESRYDIPEDNPRQFCLDLLKQWDMYSFNNYIELFFSSIKHDVNFKDFNISNIIYAAMFSTIGYAATIEYFEHYLNISDHIILNANDDLILHAHLANGGTLNSEAAIVDYNNANNPITDIFLRSRQSCNAYWPELNVEAEKAILESDIIIFSAGTQWSSLIPTYATRGFSEAVQDSKATKILVMNNTEDKDMKGQTSGDIISHVRKYLDLKDIIILFNVDADDNLRKIDDPRLMNNFFSMGSLNGKHRPYLLAKTCLKIHYVNITQGSPLDKTSFLFDFDDTIYSRLANQDKELEMVSLENVYLLNNLAHRVANYDKSVYIVSGNSYESIFGKISPIFGAGLDGVKFRIFADGGLVEYKNNKIINYDKKHFMEGSNFVYSMLQDLGIEEEKITFRGKVEDRCMIISVKPLDDKYRTVLCAFLNTFFISTKMNNIARKTGFATVDVMHKDLTKDKIFNMCEELQYTFYVGDEIDSGNDTQLAKRCNYSLQVKSIYDTNLLLRFLVGEFNQ